MKQEYVKVYLAGAMEFIPDSGAGWRDKATKLLDQVGAHYFNPCTDENALLKKHKYDTAKDFHQSKVSEYQRFRRCMHDIAKDDLIHLASSDYVIVYITPGLTGGTIGELTCAKYIYNVPVYAVWHPEADRKGISGWAQACCDQEFNSFEEAVQQIQNNIDSQVENAW